MSRLERNHEEDAFRGLRLRGAGRLHADHPGRSRPINIYAKLDADVRVRLDKEVQSAIQQNPDLF